MAKKNENRGFDHKGIPWARDIRSKMENPEALNPRQHHLLMYLSTRCGPTHTCYVAQTTIAKDLGRSRQRINADLAHLEDLGLIKSETTWRNGVKTYSLCIEAAVVTDPTPKKSPTKLLTVEELKAKANAPPLKGSELAAYLKKMADD